MARKRKNRNKKNYGRKAYRTLTRKTRRMARLQNSQRLRFSPQNTLESLIAPQGINPPRERRAQPRQAVKPQRGIKKLAISIQPDTIKKQVCKRRQQRKEIIHAFNKSGQGGQRKPDNLTRGIKC